MPAEGAGGLVPASSWQLQTAVLFQKGWRQALLADPVLAQTPW